MSPERQRQWRQRIADNIAHEEADIAYFEEQLAHTDVHPSRREWMIWRIADSKALIAGWEHDLEHGRPSDGIEPAPRVA